MKTSRFGVLAIVETGFPVRRMGCPSCVTCVTRVLWVSSMLCVLLLSTATASASELLDRLRSQDRLTGSWFGVRSKLEERGLTFESFYSFEVLGNVSGGVRRDLSTLGNVDLVLTTELEPLLGWPGARVFLYGLGNHGGNPSKDVGDLQGVSDIEAVDTWKLFEAWFEQDLFSERLSILAGLYDVNSEFDVIPAADLFLHSSHGIGAEFGLSGRNGPSIFPTTSLAARIQVRPTDEMYARLVVADGIPGDLNDPRGTHIRFDSRDGVLVVAEIGFDDFSSREVRVRTRFQVEERPAAERGVGQFGKYAVGVWGYSGEFDDFVRVDASGDPRTRDGSFGVYALAEQRIFFERDDPFQGLSVYARAGFADKRTDPVDGYVGAGVVYRGLIAGRDGDRLGFGVAAAHLSRDFRKGRRRAGSSSDDWEVALELTYRVQATAWLSIQPDVQYVINPGGDTGLSNAVVVGTRFVVSL